MVSSTILYSIKRLVLPPPFGLTAHVTPSPKGRASLCHIAEQDIPSKRGFIKDT